MFGETRLAYRRRTVLGCWSVLADLFRICLLVYVGVFAPGSMAEAETIPLPREHPRLFPASDRQRRATARPRRAECGSPNLPYSSLKPITGPGECTAADVLAVDVCCGQTPRCHLAARNPALPNGGGCGAMDNEGRGANDRFSRHVAAQHRSLDPFDCRPRNGIAGAQISEHGRANALDVRSFTLTNGSIVELTNASVSKSLRERMRDSACVRFSTVLGNGADAYHDTHVHIDLIGVTTTRFVNGKCLMPLKRPR